jgi:hypothetical protein
VNAGEAIRKARESCNQAQVVAEARRLGWDLRAIRSGWSLRRHGWRDRFFQDFAAASKAVWALSVPKGVKSEAWRLS